MDTAIPGNGKLDPKLRPGLRNCDDLLHSVLPLQVLRYTVDHFIIIKDTTIFGRLKTVVSFDHYKQLL